MPRPFLLAVALGLVATLGSTTRIGATETNATEAALPEHSLLFDSLLAFRANPLGFEEWLHLYYRFRLFDRPGLLWRDNHIGLALTPTFTPAVTRLGATVTFKPLALFSLSAGYYYVAWFGTFDYLQSYRSARAPYSDSDLAAGTAAGANYSTTGTELQLQANLLLKVGPIVLSNKLNVHSANARLQGDDLLYYDIRSDMMVPNKGWYLTHDLDLVWLSDFGLVAGLRSSLAHAFYQAKHFAELESTENPSTPIWRLGPLLAFTFDDVGPQLKKPTVLFIVNWWLVHKYRTGQDVNQAIPYLVLGFKFEGDLWSK